MRSRARAFHPFAFSLLFPCFFLTFALIFSYFCPAFFLTFSLCLLGFSFFPLLQKSFSCAIIFMYRHYLTIISIIFHCHTSAFYGFIGCIRGARRMRAEARLLGFGLKETEKPKNRENEDPRNRGAENPRIRGTEKSRRRTPRLCAPRQHFTD